VHFPQTFIKYSQRTLTQCHARSHCSIRKSIASYLPVSVSTHNGKYCRKINQRIPIIIKSKWNVKTDMFPEHSLRNKNSDHIKLKLFLILFFYNYQCPLIDCKKLSFSNCILKQNLRLLGNYGQIPCL